MGNDMEKGYLHLKSGQVFEGLRFGRTEGDSIGELVFSTSMAGYIETLTDPSYYGQMVVQTFPLIGNVGVISDDFEHPKPWITAYIVRELCDTPSNFRCEDVLNNFLVEFGIPGFQCDDTRTLTRIIREQGVVNAILTDSETLSPAQQAAMDGYQIVNAVETVTCEQSHQYCEGTRRVVLMDFGSKGNIASCLKKRDCAVTIVPAHTPAADILALKPDGIMLSNGPGDPADNPLVIRTIAALMNSGVPIFGICLGHQLMALATGGRTRKMKFGHRGANQPVQNLENKRVFITSQNHGYCVVDEALGANAKTLYRNVNDGTCEGVRYLNAPAFSTQFHPEACGGPLDTGFLFDEFMDLMDKEGKNNA